MSSAYDAEATRLTGIRVIEAGMRAKGQRILSLDVEFEDGGTLWDVVVDQAGEPATYDDDVRDITELCELSPLEARLAQYIWDGEHYGTTPSDKLCQLMYPDDAFDTRRARNATKSKVRSVYAGLQAKLLAEWAPDLNDVKRPRLRSSDEDSRRLIIGGPRQWGPQVRNPSLEVRISRPA